MLNPGLVLQLYHYDFIYLIWKFIYLIWMNIGNYRILIKFVRTTCTTNKQYLCKIWFVILFNVRPNSPEPNLSALFHGINADGLYSNAKPVGVILHIFEVCVDNIKTVITVFTFFAYPAIDLADEDLLLKHGIF